MKNRNILHYWNLTNWLKVSLFITIAFSNIKSTAQSAYSVTVNLSQDTIEIGQQSFATYSTIGDTSGLSYEWEYQKINYTIDEPFYSSEMLISDTLNYYYISEGAFEIKLHVYHNSIYQLTLTNVLIVKMQSIACNAPSPNLCELVCNFNFETTNPNIPLIGMGMLHSASGYFYFARQSSIFGSQSCGSLVVVPNPDYFNSPNGWTLGNNTQPNPCYPSNNNTVATTSNFAGDQSSHNSGNAYAGIRTFTNDPVGYYLSNPTARYDTREYILGSLTSPIVANQTYYVSFWVSLADNCNYASDQIGLKFITYNGFGAPNCDNSNFKYNYVDIVPENCSNGLIYPELITELSYSNGNPVIPDVINTNGIISDKLNWVQISGTFVSTTGNENWFIIGNFNNDANTNFISVANGLPCMNNQAYYYVDDISVSIVPTTVSITATPNPVCSGQSVTLTANPALPNSTYTWYDASGNIINTGLGITSIIVNPTTTTSYTVKLFTQCDDPTASITINVGSANVNAGPDQTICPGAAVNLSATTTSTSNQTYEWFIGNTSVGQGQNINITPTVSPTIYTVVATDVASGCTASDNMTVNFYNTTPMTISAPNSSCCTNPNINVNPDYVNYFWSITPIIAIPGQGTDIITPVLDPNTSYDICLSAIDFNGCKVEQCVHINSCCTPNDPIPSSGVQEFGKCSNGPLLISQLLINTSNTYIVFYQDLVIDQTTSFNNANIRMAPGTTITVNPSVTLIFNESVIKALCPEMWNGITVFDPTSTVRFTKSSEIWDAIDAVYSDNGGVYQISDKTQMVNNHRSLVVTNFTGIHPGNLDNSDVYTTSANLYPPYSGQRMYQGVYIANGGRVTIGRKVNFTNMDYGIYSMDANVDVYGNIFDKIDRPSNVNPCALCPAPVGTSIYAGTKIVFAQRNLRVGSTTVGDDNRIKNGYIGIESTGKIDQKIIGNFINNMEEAGIVAMNGNTRDIQINQNEINHTKFGIHTIDMPFSKLTIKNNVIKNSVFQCSFPCLENIGIMVENVLSPDMKLDISNNDISKKRKGIYLRNVSTTDPALDMIENNIIDFPQLSSNGVGASPYIGVELSGCKYVTVDENTITKPGFNPISSMTTLANGVKSTNSSDCIISNNIIKKMGSGVTAKDGNLNTVIVCNEYEKCYTGIDFVNAKINNHLPAPTNYSQRNKWINNFGPYKITGAIVSAPINFWYSSGLFQNPIPFNVSLTTFAINQPALSPSSFNVCGTLYAVPPNEERANKLEAVVLENDTTSIFETEHKWQNKNYAYHKLKKNLNWLNLSQSDDVYYQSYLQLNQNQFVGKSFEVDSILQAEDLTNAKIMLSQLNPTNYMEENILKTDSIYFEYISDSTGIISNQIDFNFLNDLAFMDPLIAGPSVYSARVLLQLDPDDEMNSSRKYNSDENIEENTYFDFVVMPNPSDENTQIVFSELIEYKLFVYDIEGRLIQNLSGNSNRCYLSTIDLETGFYLIRIESKYGTKSSKISVVHH